MPSTVPPPDQPTELRAPEGQTEWSLRADTGCYGRPPSGSFGSRTKFLSSVRRCSLSRRSGLKLNNTVLRVILNQLRILLSPIYGYTSTYKRSEETGQTSLGLIPASLTGGSSVGTCGCGWMLPWRVAGQHGGPNPQKDRAP